MRKIACQILLISVYILCACISVSNAEIKNISSVTFNSISSAFNGGSEHLRFTVKAKEAGNLEAVIDTNEGVNKLIEYFFIGLAVPYDKFWVNLNPHEPNRIIDNELGNTNLGRILLAADLKLKQDACRFTNPQNSNFGKEYWRLLIEKAAELNLPENQIPVSTRFWIVPDEVLVSQNEGQIHIVKSSLKVCLESAYLSEKISIGDPRQKQLQDYASGLMEKLILPQLNKEVNEGYAYSDLRQVYQSLILARCYRNNPGMKRQNFSRALNTRNVLSDAHPDYLYSPAQIYLDYLASLKKGEYSFSQNDTTMNSFLTVRSIRHYFSGGVDFRTIKIDNIGDVVSNIQAQESNASYFFCDLYIPADTDRPLQYAKNWVSSSPNRLAQNRESVIALLKGLPAITPLKPIDQKKHKYDIALTSNKIHLSKL